MSAETMQIEPVQLLGGETGRDFILYDAAGRERFSARLMDGSTELTVSWTDNLPLTVLRLRSVQELAGGRESISSVTGLACDKLEAAILADTFDLELASRLLRRSLGGGWQVEVASRPTIEPRVFDVFALRIEYEP